MKDKRRIKSILNMLQKGLLLLTGAFLAAFAFSGRVGYGFNNFAVVPLFVKVALIVLIVLDIVSGLYLHKINKKVS